MPVEVSALLRRMANQDDTALATLYAEYATPVYSLARRVLGDEALAQEVTQDTFLKVWKNPDAWDPSKGQFVSWLLTLTRYTAVDRLRSEVRRTGRNTELHDEIEENDGQDSAPDFSVREVREMLLHLPHEQRLLIELAFYQGMKHSELAEKLDLPLGTVKTRLRLGLQKLRKMMTDAS